jgi:hypothetical protein
MIGLATTVDFTSKAEALRYALESTSKFEERTVVFNYDAAQELYDFICKNVNIPDVNKTVSEDLRPLIDAIARKLEVLDATKECYAIAK